MPDAITPAGPCESWAAIEDLPDGCPCLTLGGSGDEQEPSDERLEELLAEATDILWSLLARPAIGLCEVTIHPCLRIDRWRLRRGGNWVDPTRLGWGVDRVGYCPSDAVLLDTPVNDITEVVVDGDVLDPSEYQLIDAQWLLRVDDSWPSGSLEDLDAFRITYDRGVPVPPLVRDATIEIANVLWQDRCEGNSCLPPRTVTSMSQANVSYSYEQPQTDAERVRSAGDAMTVTWRAIGVYNPTQQPTGLLVYGPDEPYRAHTIRQF